MKKKIPKTGFLFQSAVLQHISFMLYNCFFREKLSNLFANKGFGLWGEILYIC